MRYLQIRIIRWTIIPSILVNINKIKVSKANFGCEQREELALILTNNPGKNIIFIFFGWMKTLFSSMQPFN